MIDATTPAATGATSDLQLVLTVPQRKPWYCSRVLWFNFLSIVAAALSAAEMTLPILRGSYPGSTILLVLVFVTPIINAVLRAITTVGLAK